MSAGVISPLCCGCQRFGVQGEEAHGVVSDRKPQQVERALILPRSDR
jgi:hypothetical protein